jgi:hypothetical protein
MKIVKQKIKFTDKLAYMGTGILLVAPYLLSYKIGFVLLSLGIAMLTPQVYKAKQYNLVLLNASSIIGYTLQALNLI